MHEHLATVYEKAASWLLNAILTLGIFIMGIALRRNSIEKKEAKQEVRRLDTKLTGIESKLSNEIHHVKDDLTQHREDVLKNHPTKDDMRQALRDAIKPVQERVDKSADQIEYLYRKEMEKHNEN